MGAGSIDRSRESRAAQAFTHGLGKCVDVYSQKLVAGAAGEFSVVCPVERNAQGPSRFFNSADLAAIDPFAGLPVDVQEAELLGPIFENRPGLFGAGGSIQSFPEG